jgi:uncharacterized membrane protein YesL
MLSFEGFVRINTAATAVYRLVYLNLLWVATTVLGLVVIGFGPASYALAVLQAADGTVRALNVVALVALVIVAAYVFPVMAATEVTSVPRQLASALLLGLGSLHWTVLGGAVVGVTTWLMWHVATPLLVLFGAGIPALAVALVTRIIFRPLVESPELPGRTAHHPLDTPVTEQAS